MNGTVGEGVDEEIGRIMEHSLRGIDPLSADDRVWQSKMAALERELDPIVERVMPTLRQLLQTSRFDEAFVEKLTRYTNFLVRSPVRSRLESDRHSLLARLVDFLAGERGDLKRRLVNPGGGGGGITIGRFLTEIASKIVFLRGERAKVERLGKLCGKFLDDLPNYDRLRDAVDTYIGRWVEWDWVVSTRDM